MKYFLLLFICFFYHSCADFNKVNNKSENIINVETKSTVDAFESFFDEYHHIALETNQGNLIADIDKMQIEDNYLWILDRKQSVIYTFDNFGKYIQTFCRLGNGPEEYVDIADFQVVNGNIFVLSRGGLKIIEYKSTGEFVKNHKLDDWYDYFYMTDNSIFLYSNFSNNKLYNLLVYNRVSETYEKKFLPYNSNQSFSFDTNPFNITDKNEILLTQQYDYNIYSVDSCSVNNFVTLNFDTKDKLPEDIFEIGFMNIYEEFATKSVVKRIDFVNKNQDIIDLIYTLDYQPHLTRIDMKTGENKTIKLKFNDSIPYIFAKRIVVKNGYLINYLHASDVLLFDKNFTSDKNTDGILKAEDNPVLFFNKLKY